MYFNVFRFIQITRETINLKYQKINEFTSYLCGIYNVVYACTCTPNLSENLYFRAFNSDAENDLCCKRTERNFTTFIPSTIFHELFPTLSFFFLISNFINKM